MEVDDVDWWEHPDNDNPYGAKLRPSALAISEFLISQVNNNNNINSEEGKEEDTSTTTTTTTKDVET